MVECLQINWHWGHKLFTICRLYVSNSLVQRSFDAIKKADRFCVIRCMNLNQWKTVWIRWKQIKSLTSRIYPFVTLGCLFEMQEVLGLVSRYILSLYYDLICLSKLNIEHSCTFNNLIPLFENYKLNQIMIFVNVQ